MDLLWKKDSSSGLYVNLFENVSASVRNEFDKIKNQFMANREHHYLAKSNEKSLDYRNSGNDCFKRKDWAAAMTWYNKSLCFAENDSDNVGLAYANRAASFLQLRMYANCLADIDLAIKANYPKHLMPKLLKRQSDCMELIKSASNDDRSDSYQPSLSYDAHSKFPGMANVLELKRNNEFGRLILAKCDIPAGKTVLVEKAFSSASFNRDHCHTCLKTATNFVPCEHCAWGIFCHDTCAQQNHMHRMMCGESLIGMRELNRIDFDMANEFINMGTGRVECGEFYETIDFLTHSFLEVLVAFSSIPSLMDFVEDAIQPTANNIPDRLDDAKSMYRALLQLNVITTHANRKILFQQQAYIVFQYLFLRKDIQDWFDTEQKKRFLMHLILHQICVIFLNSFSTDDGRMNAYVLFSYLNHACGSNLRCISRSNMRYGITLRPIKAGQQLFISYLTDVFGDTSVAETQQEMHASFGFRCSNCERCKPNERRSWENSKLMQSDADYRFLSLQSSDWKKINDGRSEKEKQKILKEKTVDILNRFGSNHWCDELASMMEYYDNFIFQP